jgi:hypothetical protein
MADIWLGLAPAIWTMMALAGEKSIYGLFDERNGEKFGKVRNLIQRNDGIDWNCTQTLLKGSATTGHRSCGKATKTT